MSDLPYNDYLEWLHKHPDWHDDNVFLEMTCPYDHRRCQYPRCAVCPLRVPR